MRFILMLVIIVSMQLSAQTFDTPNVLWRNCFFPDVPQDFVFIGNNKIAATGRHGIQILNADNGETINELWFGLNNVDYFFSLGYIPESGYLVAANLDAKIYYLNPETFDTIAILDDFYSYHEPDKTWEIPHIQYMAVSKNGKYICAVAAVKMVDPYEMLIVWDAVTKKMVYHTFDYNYPAFLKFNPSGSLLMFANIRTGYSESIYVMETENWNIVFQKDFSGTEVWTLDISDNEFAVGLKNRSIYLFDYNFNNFLTKTYNDKFTSGIADLFFSNTGQYLVGGGNWNWFPAIHFFNSSDLTEFATYNLSLKTIVFSQNDDIFFVNNDDTLMAIGLLPTSRLETFMETDHLDVVPNPTKNLVNVNFTLTKAGIYELILSDEYGNTIKKVEKTFYNEGVNEIKIDLDNNYSGLYLLKMTNSKKTFYKKFIVLN